MHSFRDGPDATITVDVDALHALRENSLLQVFRLARISAGGVVTVASLSSLFPLRAGRIEGSWHLQLLEAQTRLLAYRQNKRPLTGRLPPSLILSSGRPAGLRFPLSFSSG